MLATDLLALFRKHEFLRVERWADPEGVADVEAASLMVEAADLLDVEWYREPEVRILRRGDMFSGRSDSRYLFMGFLGGGMGKVLDLMNFQERTTSIDVGRSYAVWGNIAMGGENGQAETG